MTAPFLHPTPAQSIRATFSAHLLWLLAWPTATIIYGAIIRDNYSFTRQWDWTNLAWISIAIPFLLVQEIAGLPAWTGPGIPIRKKWIIPALVGLGFGILDVLIIKVIMHPQPYETLPPFLQPFPYSIFLYPSGALDIEIFYRLIPLTLAAWIGKKWCSPRVAKHLLWTVVVLSALREPLEQWPDGTAWFLAYSLMSGFAMNFFQAVCLVKYGFLSALAVRIGHYLVWHIGLGIYVQFIEKAQV